MTIKRTIFAVILGIGCTYLGSQTAQAQHQSTRKFEFGGNAQLHYNNVVSDYEQTPGKGEFDLHKLIFKGGYTFNERLKVHAKVKYEHAFKGKTDGEAIFLEQAYIDYRLSSGLGFRAGVYSTPVGGSGFGPYYGIETDPVEKYVSYGWRELTAGVFGKLAGRLSYEAYLMSGLEASELSSHSGIYSARKHKFSSSVDNPAVAARLGYDLGQGWQAGVSAFVSGLKNSGKYGDALSGTSYALGEGHLAYQAGGFTSRIVGAYSVISGVEKINSTLGKDLGSSQYGALVEVGYDLLRLADWNIGQSLVVYSRADTYDLQLTTKDIPDNTDNDRYEFNVGLLYRPIRQVLFKADYQFFRSRAQRDIQKMNLGIWYYF